MVHVYYGDTTQSFIYWVQLRSNFQLLLIAQLNQETNSSAQGSHDISGGRAQINKRWLVRSSSRGFLREQLKFAPNTQMAEWLSTPFYIFTLILNFSIFDASL